MAKAAAIRDGKGIVSSYNALTCQLCGAPTDVINSRVTTRYGSVMVNRRRKCVTCKKTQGTIEVSRNQFNYILSTIQRFSSMKVATKQFLTSMRNVKLIDTGRDK